MAADGTIPEKKPKTETTTSRPSLSAVSKSDSDRTKSLKLAYQDWKGIPYALGGSSYSGVDCSALMQIIFEDYFDKDIPRLTKDQLKQGKKVKRSKVSTGDMVFFKTGKRTLHVGVIIEGDRFLHASTSSGVMISSLSENYWDKRYIEARRVL